VAAGKKVASSAVKLVKKVAGKIENSKLGQKLKDKAAELLKKAKKVGKKVIKAVKKLIKNALKDHKKKKHHKKHHKKGVKKHHKHKLLKLAVKILKALCFPGFRGKHCRSGKECARGAAGRKCRKERCEGHRLGCRYPCKQGGWSRRRRSPEMACRSRGGITSEWPVDFTDELEQALDIAQGILTPSGDLGSNARGNPDEPDMGTAKYARDRQGRPLIDGQTGRPRVTTEHNTFVRKTNKPYSDADEEDYDERGHPKMWNGVDPKFHGQADIPKVPRLPEDVEDCVACQYVWKQVEQDVGNSAITQTIYDSFHANAIDAQRTPVFYPACQTMFDAADDMVGDYMEGFTVNQLCENSMLCRPRDLSQFLKHQRVTKGI